MLPAPDSWSMVANLFYEAEAKRLLLANMFLPLSWALASKLDPEYIF